MASRIDPALDDQPCSYSVPAEAQNVFQNGILHNHLIEKLLPEDFETVVPKITFEGSDSPLIPVNWRFAESASALKAFEALMLGSLLKRKYKIECPEIKINTNHVQLFFQSSFMWTLDPTGMNLTLASMYQPEPRLKVLELFPDFDFHRSSNSLYRGATTNIYKCKDGKFFHVHGSMNPDPTLKNLNLPMANDSRDLDEAIAPLIAAASRTSSDELQAVTDTSHQAGTVVLTQNEYANSDHGKANAHIGLFDLHVVKNDLQNPGWWPGSPLTSAARPLAGLKVLDLTRIIAAPVMTRGLAELGASVMRITSSGVPDMSLLHPDMNLGKWNAFLDIRNETDRQKLNDLILDADVVVQGYRPGVLDKYGFSKDNILDMCKTRKRGIIYVQENCYGWNGPWASRSGWQQISDACCGVSWEYGRAMGNEEPVTPVFPNSDFCTGIIGTAAVISALIRRAEIGGSFVVDLALNYYSRWLTDSVGTYPDHVWKGLWERNGNLVFRHYHNMTYTFPRVFQQLMAKSAAELFRPSFFTEYDIITPDGKESGKKIKVVAPILKFPDGEVQPSFHIGTRTNGVDNAVWPDNLSVQVVN